MPRFTLLDGLVVIAYLCGVIAIGIRSRLKSRSGEEYFLGGRRFGRVIHFFAAFGQVTTADGPVGVATATFHNGISGIWTSLNMLFSTPLLWVVAPWLRRLRIATMADFYIERYGSRRLATVYSTIATIGMMSVLSAGFLALAKTAVALTDTSLSFASVIWIFCGFTLTNALLGGLTAAYRSAVVQGLLVLFVSIVMIPVGITRLSPAGRPLESFSELHARLPAHFFSVFGSTALPDFSWTYIVAISILAGLSTVTQPNLLVTCAAAQNESVARFGIVSGTLAKRVCTLFWGLCGLVAVALFGKSIQDSDLIWGYAARALLSPLGLGFVGLMLAAMLSAFTAASNSLMLSTAGMITRNIYRPWRPSESEDHYIAVGRITGAAFVCGAALIASQFSSLFSLLKLNWEFFIIFSAAFWFGLKWRRANCVAAWASIVIPFVLYYAAPVGLVAAMPSLRTCERLDLVVDLGSAKPASKGQLHAIFWSDGLEQTSSGKRFGRGYPYLDLFVVQSIGFDLRSRSTAQNETLRIMLRIVLPFLILFVVASVTAPDDPAISRRFFERMRTRVLDAAAPHEANVQLIAPKSQWEFYRWTNADIIGFLGTLGFIILIVGILVFLMRLGA